jgi:hypothetical protein
MHNSEAVLSCEFNLYVHAEHLSHQGHLYIQLCMSVLTVYGRNSDFVKGQA